MRAHAAIFDLFDFMEPDIDEPLRPTKLEWFQGVDFRACLDTGTNLFYTSDLSKVEEILVLRRSELLNTSIEAASPQLTAVNNEAQQLLEYFARDNQTKSLYAARVKVLKAWVQLMMLMIETGNLDRASKTTIMLRTLQTIMPRLESNLDNITEATELAKLARCVIFSLEFDAQSFNQDEMGDLIGDRLFHLFQVALAAINSLGSQTSLKQTFYAISYRYLTGMSDVTSLAGISRRHSIQTIKSAGDRFIDVVCDDAHGSEFACRIAALLVLGALVGMGKHENSKFVIEALIRLNFVGILVGSIQNISPDLKDSAPEGKSSLIFRN